MSALKDIFSDTVTLDDGTIVDCMKPMSELHQRLQAEFDRRRKVMRYSRILARKFSHSRLQYAWEKFVESEHPRDDEGKFTSTGTTAESHRDLQANTIYPVNDIEDWGLYRRLVKDFRERGWQGRPVVVVEIEDGRFQALTGSHRIIAADKAGIQAKALVISGDDAEAAKELLFVGDEEKADGLRKLGLKEAAELLDQENAVQKYSRILSRELDRLRYAKFVESEHPRDEDGKFTATTNDKGKSVETTPNSIPESLFESWESVVPGYWLRVQPKGLGIDHRSETSSGELDDGIHVFQTLEQAVLQEGQWQMMDGNHEIVVIHGPEQLADTGDVEGWSLPIGKGKIVGRLDFKEFVDEYKEASAS